MPMKAIITGGTGYIGSNLLENFIGIDITVCDRTIKKQNLKNPSCFQYIELDLIQEPLLKDFELAVQDSQIFIHSSFLGNLEQEKKLIDSIAKLNPDIKFVYFSSAAVYGDLENEYKENPHASFSEESLCEPINDYGQVKLKCEELVKNTFSNHLILRIANPYDKEVNNKGIYKLFKSKLEQGERTLNLNADFPEQIIRDFIHIDDLCKQITSLITNDQTGTFNISSGKGRTLEDLIQELCADLKINFQSIELNYTGYKPDEIKISVLRACSKSSQMLGLRVPEEPQLTETSMRTTRGERNDADGTFRIGS